MGKIIAIGGGEIGRPGYPVETEKIDRAIKELTGKTTPKLCFLHTVSEDSDLYADAVNQHFGNRIGCSVISVEILKRKYSYTALEETILAADLIYVGGGNTKFMLESWRKVSLDTILAKPLHRTSCYPG